MITEAPVAPPLIEVSVQAGDGSTTSVAVTITDTGIVLPFGGQIVLGDA